MRGTCDCCCRKDVALTYIHSVTGIETYACAVCRGEEEAGDEADAELEGARLKAIESRGTPVAREPSDAEGLVNNSNSKQVSS